MSEIVPFVPGFKTVQEALKAGQEFFAKTNGAKGQFQRDFHIVANEHGRFHFAEGRYPTGVDVEDRPPPKDAPPPSS